MTIANNDLNSANTLVIAGAGAAGCFAAITCKEMAPQLRVILVEKNDRILHKVSLTGGGRCNCTNSNLNKKALSKFYPRGSKFLQSVFTRFNEQSTVEWFKSRGVQLKAEIDGRIFPQSNTSSTITELLEKELNKNQVECIKGNRITSAISLTDECGFQITLENNHKLFCQFFCLTTGGAVNSVGISIAQNFGHTINEQIPSLFSFQVNDSRLNSLPGVAVQNTLVSIIGSKFSETGGILITHTGISGPAVIKLSSRAARDIYMQNYAFDCKINWCPEYNADALYKILNTNRKNLPRKLICAQASIQVPLRLWKTLIIAAGCTEDQQWVHLSSKQREMIVQQLTRFTVHVDGRASNKDEFVTCGGISCAQINASTMESRIKTGLYFAGEVIDIDGITGGYNLQAAWSTGWQAGKSIAEKVC